MIEGVLYSGKNQVKILAVFFMYFGILAGTVRYLRRDIIDRNRSVAQEQNIIPEPPVEE